MSIEFQPKTEAKNLELAQQGLNLYSGKKIITCSLEGGVVNDTYLVEIDEQKCVLRLYSRESFFGERTIERLTEELAFMTRCASSGISVPNVRLNQEKDPITVYSDRYLALFEYIDGEHIWEGLESFHYEQIGKVIAQMHSMVESKQIKSTIFWSEGNLWDLLLSKFAHQSSSKIESRPDVKSYIDLCTSHILDELVLLNKLPQFTIHGDLHFQNILYRDQILKGVIDFDNLHNGHLIEDVGNFFVVNALKAILNRRVYEPNLDDVRSFFQGYESIRKLSEEEKLLLPLYLQMFQSFLFYDYIGRLPNSILDQFLGKTNNVRALFDEFD